MNYVFTEHLEFEMKRRGLTVEIVESVLKNPEQKWDLRKGRRVLQSRITMDDPEKLYLIRVFLDIDREPFEVVTVYRTSKIAKYWRDEG